MVEAKICGLSTPETVEAAVRFGARFVGFVTYPKSPRHVSTETMRALGALVPKTVTRVGLFVDPDDALPDEKLATGALDLLQLHGAESPQRVVESPAGVICPFRRLFDAASLQIVEQFIQGGREAAGLKFVVSHLKRRGGTERL